LAVCPGFSVKGVVTPLAPKSDPTTEIDEIVTGTVPVEDSVTACVAVCPTFTLPNVMVVVLTLRVGVAAWS
jgi:hypothetical protein